MITADMTAEEKWTEWIYMTCDCLDRGVAVDDLVAMLDDMEGPSDRKAEIVDSVRTIALFWQKGVLPKRPVKDL